MRLIFLGPPGAGKGTQAAVVRERFGVAHISTGDILREEVRRGSDLGLTARSYMDAGKLVPDEVIIGMMGERLQAPDCSGGFLLDGFPRTVPQAEALEALLLRLGLPLDAVVLFEIDDEDVVRRLAGRRVCSSCGAIYNAHFRPPKVEGICDACGGPVVQRDDDREETVRGRLSVYHGQTAPLIDYYRTAGLLRPFDATAAPEVLLSLLGTLPAGRTA
jgi:adenylate kinase